MAYQQTHRKISFPFRTMKTKKDNCKLPEK